MKNSIQKLSLLVPALLLGGVFVIVIFVFPNRLTEPKVEATLTGYLSKNLHDNDIFPNDVDMPVQDLAVSVTDEREILEAFDANRAGNFPTLTGMDYVKYVANLFVLGTPFQGKVNINSEPKKDHINIYFLIEDNDGLVRNFDNNCTFIGYFHAIICDSKFIKRTFNDIDQLTETYNIALVTRDSHSRLDIRRDDFSRPEVRKILGSMKGNFLTWLLGHEIGHAVLHYELVIRAGEPFHLDLIYSEEEKAADRFVAEKIVLTKARAAEFHIMIAEFIEQEFRKVYRENQNQKSQKNLNSVRAWDFPVHNRIKVKHSKYRVPLLLRALRVRSALVEIEPSHDNTGYYEKIEKNIDIVESLF